MKTMRGKIVYMPAVLAVVFSMFFGRGAAQTVRNYYETPSAPLVLRQYKATNPLWRAHEAAVLDYVNEFSYADTWVGGEMSAGDFRRPQQPQSLYDIRFSAEGAQQVGRFYLNGGFGFRQSYQNDVRFSSVFDPLRGMPYIIADSTGGDWTKQSYDLWVDIAMPLVRNRFSAGLGVDLAVNRGAKKTDPRPQSNTNRIVLKPSLAFNMGRGGVLSAAFIWSMYKESSNLILYDASEPQKLYLLKGLGQYTYEIFSNTERERKYDGDLLGASAGYAFRRGGFSAALNGRYRNEVEEVYDIDYSKPHVRGKLYTDMYDASLLLNFTGRRVRHTVSADFGSTSRSGREIVQVFDPSPDVNSWVTDSEIPARYRNDETRVSAAYGLWIMRGENYLWHIAVTGGYEKTNRRYDAMNSLLDYRNVSVSLDAEKVFFIRRGFFELGVKLSGVKTLDSEYAYTERETDDATIRTGLMEPDYAILSSDYGSVSASLTYGLGLRRGRTLWVKLGGGYLMADGGLSRYGADFSVGYTF